MAESSQTLVARPSDTASARDLHPTPFLVDVAGLAALLNTSTRTVHRLNSSGRIPAPVRLGGRSRWRPDEILAWIDAGCPSRKDWEAAGKKESRGGRP